MAPPYIWRVTSLSFLTCPVLCGRTKPLQWRPSPRTRLLSAGRLLGRHHGPETIEGVAAGAQARRHVCRQLRFETGAGDVEAAAPAWDAVVR